MSGVETTRTRKVVGGSWAVVYSVFCRTCPGQPVLCHTWERYEARLIARRHTKEHRRR